MNWWIQVKCLVNWVENLRNVSKCIFIFCKKYDYYKHGSSRLKTEGKDMSHFVFLKIIRLCKKNSLEVTKVDVALFRQLMQRYNALSLDKYIITQP